MLPQTHYQTKRVGKASPAPTQALWHLKSRIADRTRLILWTAERGSVAEIELLYIG